MIVDDTGRFVTQRTEPRLALVEIARNAEGIVASAPEKPPLTLAFAELSGAEPQRRVKVWRDEVDAVDCGGAAAAWMSSWLGKAVSVVYMPDPVDRPVSPTYGRPGDVVSFADGYPLLLISSSSLDDLNARLPSPIGADRFRPNLVVSGAPPWAEDRWSRVRVGRVVLRIVKPCDRCTVTTIDPLTAERGPEPLRTLSTFRAKNNDVLFGQNCIPDSLGTIAIGDSVIVLE